MTVYENMLLLEERVKKASAYIDRLRAENDNLRREVKLIKSHNEDLQAYVDNYKDAEKIVAESIKTSLEHLNEVGLDNIDLSVPDLEIAEQFSSIGGDAVELPDFTDFDFDLDN